VKVTLWGTRGSIASAGPETVAYGGNTSCVAVEAGDGTLAILDAGTGVRRVGATLRGPRRLDILLTHLHMDHIQGLGFFAPLFDPAFEVHIWGPPSTTLDLRSRLSRYLSPPLFPVRLRDVECALSLHDVTSEPFRIGGLEVRSDAVIHPGFSHGYRLDDGTSVLTYIPDHEPALVARVATRGEWMSGFDLSAGADMLIHDCQYTAEEYAARVGWGHSRLEDAIHLARAAGCRRLVTFHHDPAHDDEALDRMLEAGRALAGDGLEVLPGREGTTWQL
jgi:phosphoribosyl 1,2-cyclic phosphodiesterase